MKKAVWVLALIIVAGYLVNTFLDRRAKEQAERLEREKIEQRTKLLVSEMVSRFNAVDNWEVALSRGEKIRLEPILTVELEKLWLTKRPILFIGAIKDIATLNDSQYTLTIERSMFGSFNYLFDTELLLSLSSPKKKIDAFLDENPNLFKDFGFNNGVAVVAQINAIRTVYGTGEEGERIEIKMGEGDLIDMSYTGEVAF